jgi:hypothetical protein
MLSMRSYAAEQYRTDIATKVRAKMVDKARPAHVTGSRTYGYTNVKIMGRGAQGREVPDHVERRIDDVQAAVLRRMFQMSAAGIGYAAIGRRFAEERIPAPRLGTRGWPLANVRDMLHNSIYRGDIVYGRTTQTYRGGRRGWKRCDPSTWLHHHDESLRIIPEDLWQAVQARLASMATVYTRKPGGRLVGRPPGTRQRTPYLLSGISQCAVCSGSILAHAPSRRRGKRPTLYRCYHNTTRGANACHNDVSIPIAEVDRLVLDAITKAILSPAMIDAYVERVVRRWESERVPAAARRATLTADLRRVETEIAALEQRLVNGDPIDLIAEPLRTRRQRRDALRAHIVQAEQHDRTSDGLSGPALRKALAAKVAELGAAFAGPLDDPEAVRGDLMRLLDACSSRSRRAEAARSRRNCSARSGVSGAALRCIQRLRWAVTRSKLAADSGV